MGQVTQAVPSGNWRHVLWVVLMHMDIVAPPPPLSSSVLEALAWWVLRQRGIHHDCTLFRMKQFEQTLVLRQPAVWSSPHDVRNKF